MQHRLFRYLKRFSIREWKKCLHFIQMETSGKNPTLIYSWLLDHKSKPDSWSINLIHHSTIPHLSRTAFLNELSKLSRGVESFHAYQEHRHNSLQKRIHLQRYFLKNDDQDLFEKSFHHTWKELTKDETISINKNLDKLKFLHQSFYSNQSISLRYQNNLLKELKNHLDLSFNSYQAFFNCTSTYLNIISKTNQIKFKETLPLSDPTNILNELNALIAQSSLEEIQNFLLKYKKIENFDSELKSLIYTIMVTLLRKRIIQFNERTLLSDHNRLLFKYIKTTIFELNLPIQSTTINNYVNGLIAANQMNDLKVFIKILESRNTNKNYNFILKLSQAQYLLSKSQYGESIELLRNLSPSSFQENYLIRLNLTVAYSLFYIKSDQFPLVEIENFKKYIKYNKDKLSVSSYLGSIRFCEILTMIVRGEPTAKIEKLLNVPDNINSRSSLWLTLRNRDSDDNP